MSYRDKFVEYIETQFALIKLTGDMDVSYDSYESAYNYFVNWSELSDEEYKRLIIMIESYGTNMVKHLGRGFQEHDDAYRGGNRTRHNAEEHVRSKILR